MNEYVQEFLAKIDVERQNDRQRQLQKIATKLKIGERVYSPQDFNMNDYPYWDSEKRKYYRYDVGNVSEEEFNLLMKNVPDTIQLSTLKKEVKRSNWYSFATVMMVLGGLAILVTLIFAIEDNDWMPFIIAIASYLVELGFWSIVQLLAGIKQGIDNLLNK